VACHPELLHVAEAGAWPSIRRFGLLSTSALLDRFQVTGLERERIEAAPRPDAVLLKHPAIGEAWIRDNRPLRPTILAASLDGISPAEWIRLLSGRVFFWVDRGRAVGLIEARAHRNRSHDVLVLDTRRVLAHHGGAIDLTAFNTGAALFPGGPRRGPSAFTPLSHYRAAQRVVELTVRYSMPDIEELTLRVERWQAGRPAATVWSRKRPHAASSLGSAS
jgi:uncharacterized protein DUF7002